MRTAEIWRSTKGEHGRRKMRWQRKGRLRRMLLVANGCFIMHDLYTYQMSTPGVEPGLSRPQRDVLTTRRCGPHDVITSLEWCEKNRNRMWERETGRIEREHRNENDGETDSQRDWKLMHEFLSLCIQLHTDRWMESDTDRWMESDSETESNEWDGGQGGRGGDKMCISRESNPGHIDGNVFYH